MNGEKKMMYVAPSTIRNSVELEGTFCASADVENPQGLNGEIEEQKINSSFDIDNAFQTSDWEKVE